MFRIEDYIGQEVRRFIYMMRRSNGQYVHLFSIWEHLDSEMQDAKMFTPNTKNGVYIDFIKSAPKDDKIFLAIDNIVLTQEMLDDVANNLVVGGKDIIYPICSEYSKQELTWKEGVNVLPLGEDTLPMKSIFPKRQCSAFVDVIKPQKDNGIKIIKASDKLCRQLSALSNRNFGYDICDYKEHWGEYWFVTYNPIYRSLSWREMLDEQGVYCQINYRAGRTDKLWFKIIAHDAQHEKLYSKTFESISYLNKFQLGNVYAYLEVIVREQNGYVVDYYPHMNSIHSIKVDVGVHDKTLRVVDEKNNIVREIEKYVGDKPFFVGEIPNECHWDYNENEYKELEKNLDFVFFEGEKLGEDGLSKKKGIAAIQKIVDSAREKCYIVDSYFDEEAFKEYIWGMNRNDVEVCILSSKEHIGGEKRKTLKNRLEEYKDKVGGNVCCRLLCGAETPLHDRFIVADEKVWMLGCSLNHFGEKATTLVRVPKAYTQRMIDVASKMWNSNETSEEL